MALGSLGAIDMDATPGALGTLGTLGSLGARVGDRNATDSSTPSNTTKRRER